MRPTAPTNRTTLAHRFFSTDVARRLVEETEAHVVVGLLLLLSLLLGGSVLGSGARGGGTTSSGGSGTRAGADVQEELLDVLALESL